ncbi:hypothetical protein Tco_0619437 [Tanacetum coccineum]
MCLLLSSLSPSFTGKIDVIDVSLCIGVFLASLSLDQVQRFLRYAESLEYLDYQQNVTRKIIADDPEDTSVGTTGFAIGVPHSHDYFATGRYNWPESTGKALGALHPVRIIKHPQLLRKFVCSHCQSLIIGSITFQFGRCYQLHTASRVTSLFPFASMSSICLFRILIILALLGSLHCLETCPFIPTAVKHNHLLSRSSITLP